MKAIVNTLVATSMLFAVSAVGCAYGDPSEENASQKADDVGEIEQAVNGQGDVDTYTLSIPWSGGYGQKPTAICKDGYYASAIQNEDLGNNNQKISIKCTEVQPFLRRAETLRPYCETIPANWSGGYGEKEQSMCDAGMFVTGFAIFDAGNNNQYVNKIRCCEMEVDEYSWTNSDDYPVSWSGGEGPKPWTSCDEDAFIVGIANFDWGKNNQSVHRVHCAVPQREIARNVWMFTPLPSSAPE